MAVVMKPRVVICAVEGQPCPGRCRFKPHLRCLELALPCGLEPGLDCLRSREGLDHHRTMAPVPCVSNGEAEIVELFGDCVDDLRDCTLPASDELDGGEAGGDGEVAAVSVLDWSQGLDDPTRQRGDCIQPVRREEDAGGEVLEHMGAHLETSVLYEIACG